MAMEPELFEAHRHFLGRFKQVREEQDDTPAVNQAHVWSSSCESRAHPRVGGPRVAAASDQSECSAAMAG